MELEGTNFFNDLVAGTAELVVKPRTSLRDEVNQQGDYRSKHARKKHEQILQFVENRLFLVFDPAEARGDRSFPLVVLSKHPDIGREAGEPSD